jgi:hypothetical protein
MHAIAEQQCARMVCGRVTSGGIGIASAPGQNGRTIDNEIASPDQMTPRGTPDGEDEERLKERCSCGLPAFAQLRWARNAWLASCVQRQTTARARAGQLSSHSCTSQVGRGATGF